MKITKPLYLTVFFLSISINVNADNTFIEKAIDIKFSYSNSVSIDFNPHHMKETQIYLNRKWVGSLVISSKPIEIPKDQYLAIGIDHYKDKYKTDKVSLDELNNKAGLNFHIIRIAYRNSNQERIIEKYVNFKKVLSESGDLLLILQYSFNFHYPIGITNSDKESLLEIIETTERYP